MPNLVVENPIICNPYKEPDKHFNFTDEGVRIVEGRRPSGYVVGYLRRKKVTMIEEKYIESALINEIRVRVKKWREAGYPGVTSVTKKLLEHWQKSERTFKLFFCQLEAAETIIWLYECPNLSRDLKIKAPHHFARYCVKLATGTGKTVVMAMIIAWTVLNNTAYSQKNRFTDTILVVCPNLTVKRRLEVLYPSGTSDGQPSYYDKFELIPSSMKEMLTRAKIFVTNWHLFEPEVDAKRSVQQRGEESDAAFVKRILKNLGYRKNILVLNDEGHHAHQPTEDEKQTKLFEIEKEIEEDTVWIKGLEKIHKIQNIQLCIDFSATPYYLKSSGFEGKPFEWIVSDFGLIDAVESGLVKSIRLPFDDNSGDSSPRYLNLWSELKSIMSRKSTEGDKLGNYLIKTEGALGMLYSSWKKTFESWRSTRSEVDPVMIIVCNDTRMSEYMYNFITKSNNFPEFQKEGDIEHTVRIDTALLAKAEERLDGNPSSKDNAERLREIVATVGKKDKPGEKIRCVISVGMLSEGWDAKNVTHILGLKAFESQLLCEQVVGRGLRRMDYDNITDGEEVDVYGIPFQVFPIRRAKTGTGGKPPRGTMVHALKERKRKFEITFPIVTNFIHDIGFNIKVDVDSLPEMRVSPSVETTKTYTKIALGRFNKPKYDAPGDKKMDTRLKYQEGLRLNTICFNITADIVNSLKDKNRLLFPQILKVVKEYVDKKVTFDDEAPIQDLNLQKYRNRVINHIIPAIKSYTKKGEEKKILPILNQFKKLGTTRDVNFRTLKTVYPTTKSHVSHVVLDSNWERLATQRLEECEQVISYVKNNGLDFEIQYKYEERMHKYLPDFIIKYRCKNEEVVNIILEIKGRLGEAVTEKTKSAKMWVDAINNYKEFGKWHYILVTDPHRIISTIKQEIPGES
ncbi:MAG: DEAD/DEAH box helicase family protein [Candidatus Aenigmarchaeota archaeon]|nr:DEAD/DEAH box helicase family protein [Candidatus Aenigmarchaeota archaeon]